MTDRAGDVVTASDPGRAPAGDRRTAFPYDAFISYRHSARQMAIARALQRALHGFAKPWYRLRAVRLYRDETSLSARPNLWGAIEAALDRSRFLLLMASPEAATSQWVEKEVAHWLDTRGEESLLIVVTDGTVAWDARRSRFDPVATTALPPSALARLTAEPFWIDMTWAKDTTSDLRPENARFRDAVASIAATLRDTDKDVLTGEDVRQRRRAMRLAWGAAGALALLAAASIAGGALAIREGEQARREQARATSWADRRLFTISLILSQQVEGNRTFTSVDYNKVDGLTFGMYQGWLQSVGRLGRLLTAMRAADRARFDEIFADGNEAAATELVAFLNGPRGGFQRDRTDPRFAFDTREWQDRFRTAGRDIGFQRVQLESALSDFQRNRQLVAVEMPALKTERGIAFILDVITQHGTGPARRFYHAATTEPADEPTVLQRIQQQSLDTVKRIPAIAPAVQRRRELFRTTPLLLDEPLSAADLPQPSWWTDIAAWSSRIAGLLRNAVRPVAPPVARS